MKSECFTSSGLPFFRRKCSSGYFSTSLQIKSRSLIQSPNNSLLPVLFKKTNTPRFQSSCCCCSNRSCQTKIDVCCCSCRCRTNIDFCWVCSVDLGEHQLLWFYAGHACRFLEMSTSTAEAASKHPATHRTVGTLGTVLQLTLRTQNLSTCLGNCTCVRQQKNLPSKYRL